jgi:[ribosomal protein S18]-alanine N-acetyltransferase
MLPRDLPEVVAIEQATFPVPWTHANFLHEIERNPFACNRVVRVEQGAVAAYASSWMVDSEVRINNIAVHKDFRGLGYGELLLRNILELGKVLGCSCAVLEVRPSNLPAIGLYTKMGFREIGRRRGYYSDTREDALVMRVSL